MRWSDVARIVAPATVGRVYAALIDLRFNRAGATSIEYALVAILISITVVGWATYVGTTISNFFTQVGNGF